MPRRQWYPLFFTISIHLLVHREVYWSCAHTQNPVSPVGTGTGPYTRCVMANHDAEMDLLCRSVLDFAERALEAVLEYDQVSSTRQHKLAEFCHQALQYAMLLENVGNLVVPFIESLNERHDYKRAWPGQEVAVYVKMADNRE